MRERPAHLPLVFSSLGHCYMHLFTAFYFIIVLALEEAWALPYHEPIELWTLGSLMVGLAALPAGWLGDRWSASYMYLVISEDRNQKTEVRRQKSDRRGRSNRGSARRRICSN